MARCIKYMLSLAWKHMKSVIGVSVLLAAQISLHIGKIWGIKRSLHLLCVRPAHSGHPIAFIQQFPCYCLTDSSGTAADNYIFHYYYDKYVNMMEDVYRSIKR